jgi:hypothetical protein
MSYAKTWNEQYSNKNSFFVDLKERLNSTIQGLSNFTKQNSARASLVNACNTFTKQNPTKLKFADLDLCESIMVPLSDILIDITMQRKLELSWVLKIIREFRDVQIQPIRLYKVEDPEASIKYYATGKNGLYASWDGQHTAMALYILCVYIFKQDPKDVLIPCVVFKVSKKAEIRKNFISENTEDGKNLLDDIDIFQQQVYGFRVDNNLAWKEAHDKQTHLETADLFVTHEKFGNTNEPGAISRMQEIGHYDSEIIRKFCLYAATVMPESGRPIASQEIEIMCAWFEMSKSLEYSDEEIVDLATHINELFKADFHAESGFWIKSRTAYENWWNDFYDGVSEEYRPSHMSFSKNWRNGGTFLWHQLKTTWGGRMPRLNINTQFKPFTKDLYNV